MRRLALLLLLALVSSATDLMSGSPSHVGDEPLNELGILIVRR